MTNYDVCGIGSPLTDIMVKVNDEVINAIGIKKGGMYLFSAEKINDVMDIIKSSIIKVVPGDSTANTIVGICNLGGSGAYFGKVGDDNYGEGFIKSIIKEGVDSKVSKSDIPSGMVIALITPDSERTMIVYLGAAKELTSEDINATVIRSSKFLHITGYQLEELKLREACLYAIEVARRNNVKISVDLADGNLISRNLGLFKRILKDNAYIIFANENEALSFTGKEPMEALSVLKDYCQIGVVKVGAKGSHIITDDAIYNIPPYLVNPVDTTGAGDMYAAGVLFGLSKGFEIEKCGKIGSFASSKVVMQVGARLNYSLKEEIKNLV